MDVLGWCCCFLPVLLGGATFLAVKIIACRFPGRLGLFFLSFFLSFFPSFRLQKKRGVLVRVFMVLHFPIARFGRNYDSF